MIDGRKLSLDNETSRKSMEPVEHLRGIIQIGQCGEQ